jgi:CRP/FNR family transcriptional regulator/CRP/FNR family cyclic AMP-dependent transcriptional regulator
MPHNLNPALSAPIQPPVFVRPSERVYNSTHTLAHKLENRPMGPEFLRVTPLFAGLTDGQLAALRASLVRRQFHQGEAIFQQGDPGQMLYLIESGQVRIFLQDQDGQEASVIVYGPGEIFGELAVIDGLPRSASAVAMADTIVYTLARDAFREHMRNMPQLALNFLNALSVRVRYTTQQVESLTLHDVSSRLARKLLELARQRGVAKPDGVQINMALTQSDLAGLVGATRESINKALGTFRRQGYILTKQNRIIIVDTDALRHVGT